VNGSVVVTTMKMMSSTSITSIMGVTLISAVRPWSGGVAAIAIASSMSEGSWRKRITADGF